MSPDPMDRPEVTDALRASAAEVDRWLGTVTGGAPGGTEAESRRLASALRTVIERMADAGTPLDSLRVAADAAEAVVDALGRHAPARHFEPPTDATGADGRGPQFFEWSPQVGRSNPVAPPLRLRVDATTATVVGEATFTAAYEGPPGCVHGGHIAAAFDEVLGMAQALCGRVGMTASLGVRYRRPTPLGTPLRFESWIVGVDGRKVSVAGRLLDGGTVTASAEALFVSVPAARFAELAALRPGGVSGS